MPNRPPVTLGTGEATRITRGAAEAVDSEVKIREMVARERAK